MLLKSGEGDSLVQNSRSSMYSPCTGVRYGCEGCKKRYPRPKSRRKLDLCLGREILLSSVLEGALRKKTMLGARANENVFSFFFAANSLALRAVSPDFHPFSSGSVKSKYLTTPNSKKAPGNSRWLMCCYL